MATPDVIPVLILMRHGARETYGDKLSLEGLRQANALVDAVEKGQIPRPEQILSSPKVRTQSTVQPIATKASLKVRIDENLNERERTESGAEFDARVKAWLVQYTNKTSGPWPILACSHVDWLEAASLWIESDESDDDRNDPWYPATRRTYVLEDGLWRRKR